MIIQYIGDPIRFRVIVFGNTPSFQKNTFQFMANNVVFKHEEYIRAKSAERLFYKSIDLSDEGDHSLIVTIEVHRLNYGNFLGVSIVTVPLKRVYGGCDPVHPFSHLKDDDVKTSKECSKTGEIIPDNEVTRSILKQMTDLNKLKTDWGYTHHQSIMASLIKALSLLWD